MRKYRGKVNTLSVGKVLVSVSTFNIIRNPEPRPPPRSSDLPDGSGTIADVQIFFSEANRMKITDIAIHADCVTQPYKMLGEITAKVSKGSLFSKSPTIEDVNFKLQEVASKMGANAVVNVTYSRGMSLMSYEVLKAVGTAVIAESDDVKCRFCAETIKRAAKKCKHCRSDLELP